MSFTDRLMLWLHVAFVIFTIGPVTIAIMSTPRYIRTRNVAVLRYLLRLTRIFGVASLGVLAFGLGIGQSLNLLSKPWVTVSMTLFVVSLVLLVLIMRDQRRAIAALETAATDEALSAVRPTPAPKRADQARAGSADRADGSGKHGPDGDDSNGEPASDSGPNGESSRHADGGDSVTKRAAHIATVERGRIASLGGIVSLIWLAVLVLMIWNS
jgi:hypothetical protein